MSFISPKLDTQPGESLLNDTFVESTEGEGVQCSKGSYLVMTRIISIVTDADEEYEYETYGNSYKLYFEANTLEDPETWNRLPGMHHFGSSLETGFDTTVAGESHPIAIVNDFNNEIRAVLVMSENGNESIELDVQLLDACNLT